MKIKKGFVKNNWPGILILGIVVILVISSWDFVLALLAVVFIISIGMRYKKYDEIEQEADDWWNGLSKEDKQKVREKQ